LPASCCKERVAEHKSITPQWVLLYSWLSSATFNRLLLLAIRIQCCCSPRVDSLNTCSPVGKSHGNTSIHTSSMFALLKADRRHM
jgi:hypothetical protein